jgi:hypothetical protein
MSGSTGTGKNSSRGPVEARKRRLLRGILLIAVGTLCLITVWLWWPATVSKSFGNCIHQRKDYYAYHELREQHLLPVLVNVRIALDIACGLHVANGYHDALIAFSGVAVAGFTATLWWATHGTVLSWVIIPGWKNSGSTPARHVVCHVSLYYQQGYRRLPDSFDFPERWDDGEPEVFMVSIAPHGQIGDAARRIPIAELMASLQKTKRIFMYGWIEYDDAFPETHRHRTEFCVEIIVRTNPRIDYGKAPQGSRVLPFLFSFQGRHNGTEDECSKKAAPPELRLAELRESRRNALAPRPGDLVRPEHDEFLPITPTPPSG